MTVKGEGRVYACMRARPRACEDDRYEENVCEPVPAHSHTQFSVLLADGRSIYGVVLTGPFMSK